MTPITLCVFCGANTGHDARHAEAARAVGHAIGVQGLGLVYGGGQAGLMGIVADAALAAGAPVTGVIPQRLMARELGHPGVTELLVVPGMHERKREMAARAQAFLALSGGLGTMEELFEIWTWRQLGYHRRPIGLLDIAGFYAPLRQFLAGAAGAGFVGQATLDELLVDVDPARLVAALARDARTLSDGHPPPDLSVT